ncbi:MAG: leucine-rich repeat protein, partial [Alloprevotella sp.]|nr:leucine-rich repeat protein [Alloprevotella sp.]
SSVTSIGSFAFLGCTGLTSIKVAAGNTKYDSRDNCQAIIETASNTLIAGCMNSTIPNSVTSIGDNAFYGCTGLTSINIPNSVTSIGSSAFEGCASLTSITIPNSVTKINYRAFSGCTGLTDIYALRTGPDAYNCDTYAFEDVTTSTCTLHVPQGSTEAYKANEPWYRFENIVEEDFASDLNGDYTVNVGDVTTLVNIILSKEGAEVEGFDLNGDGAVNVGDVTTLVDKILGRE